MNIYGSLHGENGANIEDGLWVLLGNKAGDAFWGKASKPLTAETPVKVSRRSPLLHHSIANSVQGWVLSNRIVL